MVIDPGEATGRRDGPADESRGEVDVLPLVLIVGTVALLPILIQLIVFGFAPGVALWLIPVLVIALVFIFLRKNQGGDSQPAETSNWSDEIVSLKAQYARGEIDEAEFEQLLDALDERDGPDGFPADFETAEHAQFESIITETVGHVPPTTEAAGRASRSSATAEEHLRRRFASGEMTEAEFRRRLAVLRETTTELE